MKDIYRPTPLNPVPRPELSDATVDGDSVQDPRVSVLVGGVTFDFWRLEDGTWTGGQAVTGIAGYELDERWLPAARGVAVEALRADVLRRGAAPNSAEQPTEVVRCPECERLLCSPLLVRPDVRRTGVDCGPAHVVRFEDRRELVFPPNAPAEWAPAQDM